MVEYYQRRSSNEAFMQVKEPYPAASVWVHLPDRKPDLKFLVDEYKLDPGILQDALDRHELPRSESGAGGHYVFLRLPTDGGNYQATALMLAIIQPNIFITLSPFVNFSPKLIDVFITTKNDRTSSLLVATMAGIVYRYETKIHELEEKISSARRRLKRHDIKSADFIEFVTIDDSLNEYRSNLEGLAGVTKKLEENRHKLFLTSELEALEDIRLHIQQLLVSIGASSQTINSIQNAYSTVANNRLNERMKMLTAITILLAIPNVFYGMYGMNVGLPFQHEPWAYPVIVSFTVLLILLIYLLARRLRLF